MDRTEKFLVNLSSNWIGFALTALITLLLTPFVLGKLGIERYGIWVLIMSFIGTYGMLDLGFRAGVNQFLIRSMAANDFSRASRVISTALIALSVVGAATLIATLLSAFLLPKVTSIPKETVFEAQICILLVGTAAAFQVIFAPFGAIFVALQRFDIVNIMGVSQRLVAAAGTVWALSMGYGLVGVAGAVASARIGADIVRCVVSLRMAPQLMISWANRDMTELRGIASFGLANFMIAVSEHGYSQFLPIVIAFVLPLSAVGHFGLAEGLWRQLKALFAPIGHVFYPVAAEFHVKQQRKRLQSLYTKGTRMYQLIVISIVIVAIMWADDFYKLWIGAEYLDGDPFISVAAIFKVMSIATVLAYSANVTGQILVGAGHVRSAAVLKISGLASTLLLSVPLIWQFGLIGVPIAMVLTALVFDLIGAPLLLRRKEGLFISYLTRLGGLRAWGVAAVLVSVFYVLKSLWTPTTWVELVAHGLLAALAIVIAVGSIGVDEEERQKFIVGPLRKLLKRFKG